MFQFDPMYEVFRLAFFASLAFSIFMGILCAISSRRTSKLRKKAEEAGVIPDPKRVPPPEAGQIGHYWAFLITIIITLVVIVPLGILAFSGGIPQIDPSSPLGRLLGVIVWIILLAGVIPGFIGIGIYALRKQRRIYEVALGMRSADTLPHVSDSYMLEKCFACGASLRGKEKFCGKCGIALREQFRRKR